MDEYLSSLELVALMDKLEERYGFSSVSEEAVEPKNRDAQILLYC